MRVKPSFSVLFRTTIMLSLAIIATLGPVRTASASPEPHVYIDPAVVIDPLASVLTLEVWISDVEDLYTYGVNVKWYGPVLQAISATEGPFLLSGGATFFFGTPYNGPDPLGDSDYFTCGGTAIWSGPGVSGSGMLFSMEFSVESPGTTGLALFLVELMDSRGYYMDYTLGHGYFSSVSWAGMGYPGDIDADYDVDIGDLMIVVRAMGTDDSWPSGTGWHQWNPQADVNEDGKVNTGDLWEVAAYYGRPYGPEDLVV